MVNTFFEEGYAQRPTPGSLIAQLFPNLVSANSKSNHQEFQLGQTGDEGIAGSQWELNVDFPLAAGAHLYAPGALNYQTLQLELEEHPLLSFGSVDYPDSRSLFLEAIGESVPTFSGFTQLKLPIEVKTNKETKSLSQTQNITIRGTLKYQICTESVCHLPKEEKVEWTFKLKPLDRRRSPDKWQHQ